MGILTDFYIYSVDFNSLAGSTTQTGNINIQADSDFKVNKLSFFADLNNTAQTSSTRVIPLVTVQITDSSSGRNLMDRAVMVSEIFGDGQLPFILPQPKIFPARSNVSIVVQNTTPGTTYNLRLAFIGSKIFRTG